MRSRLTGKSLFTGETAVEILGQVLNREPDISEAPRRVQPLLRWCLEKERKDRLAAIGDARRLLAEGETAPVAAATTPVWQRPVAWLFPALALVAAVALWKGPAPVEQVSARLSIPLPPGQR